MDFILGEVKNYLSSDVQVRRGDVLAAWSGIRPLVLNPNKKDTQSIARNHIIHVSDSGLVTIGGKMIISILIYHLDLIHMLICLGLKNGQPIDKWLKKQLIVV